MNTARSIVIPFPLPCKLVAESGSEMKDKIKSMARMHGAFLVTLTEEEDGRHVSYLRKY